MSNEVSTIVPTAKSERVVYVLQLFDYLWFDCKYYHELKDARSALVSRQNKRPSEKYRIIKRTIIEEVVE